MPWYGFVIIACIIIGPFDALYLYIKAGRRRQARREREEEASRREE